MSFSKGSVSSVEKSPALRCVLKTGSLSPFTASATDGLTLFSSISSTNPVLLAPPRSCSSRAACSKASSLRSASPMIWSMPLAGAPLGESPPEGAVAASGAAQPTSGNANSKSSSSTSSAAWP